MFIDLKFIDNEINLKEVSEFLFEIKAQIQMVGSCVEHIYSVQYEEDSWMVHFWVISLIKDEAGFLLMSMLILATLFESESH